MPFLDVYIGITEIFKELYERPNDESVGRDYKPRYQVLRPFFPMGHIAFFLLLERIKDGSYEGKQLDWGAWAAKLKREEIRKFVDEVYGTLDDKYLHSDISGLYTFIDSLDSEETYFLVASEL